jgi:hypothetical protein
MKSILSKKQGAPPPVAITKCSSLTERDFNKRPLLKKIGEDNLEQGLLHQLNDRKPFYSRAHVILPYQKNLEEKIVQYILARTKSQR